tara:strand:+ start:170 stop:490 length:321 start_codon:yes stop_codon:yes gene_type:complete
VLTVPASAYCRPGLHWAALGAESDGAKECLQLLFDREPEKAKAALNSTSNSGSTPLHCALTRGHEHAVRLLVQQGADKKVKDEDGKTAADLAKAHSKAMVKVLNGK